MAEMDVKEAKMKVMLLAHTPEPEKVCGIAAWLCYKPIDIEEAARTATVDVVRRSLEACLHAGHMSVIEHAYFTFGIEGVSRALTHQLVRHRIASYCLTGDTLIKGARQKSKNYKKFTLKSLYKRTLTPHGRSRLRLIRLNSYDENRQQFSSGKIENVIYTGKQKVWIVKLVDGRNIKSTLNHKFLTKSGWLTLEEIIKTKPALGVNGIVCRYPNLAVLRDKNWLYERYNVRNLTHDEIARDLGCSEHTVRSWVRKHGLQKEIGGLHGHKQHSGYHWKLGRERTTDERMAVSKRMKGPNNPMWRGGITKESVRLRRDISPELRRKVYERDGFQCRLCHNVGGELTLHHKIPLYADKTKNTEMENLTTVCRKCHRKINNHEHECSHIFGTAPIPYHSKSSGCFRTIKWVDIKSIEYDGIEDTYDITMLGPNHNFVANGFVVHNSQQSQRYVDKSNFSFVIPPSIKGKPELERKFIEAMKSIPYDELAAHVPKEDARFVLPNATETKIIATMNARSLYNFFELRLCTHTQWEIRMLAQKMLELVRGVAPILFKYAGPPCAYRGVCREKEPCQMLQAYGARHAWTDGGPSRLWRE